jgi:hypothetical protein
MFEVDWELLQFSNEYRKAQSVSLKISCSHKYAIKDYAIKDKPMRKHCKKTLAHKRKPFEKRFDRKPWKRRDHNLFQKRLDRKLFQKKFDQKRKPFEKRFDRKVSGNGVINRRNGCGSAVDDYLER